MMEPRGYKIREVATMLQYCRSTVYDLIKAKRLLTYGSGAGMRVRADSLDAFIAGGETWPGKALAAEPKAKARTGQTAQGTTTDGTAKPSPILIDKGRKLNLNS